MEAWAKKWQMWFHPNKCVLTRLCKNHPNFTYKMHDKDDQNLLIDLKESTVEKDLGIDVDEDLSFSHHIQQCVSKANK